jgi:excisionase family DNA binding protein
MNTAEKLLYRALWTVTEVAAYLRVSRSWVYNRAAAGLLPCMHVGALVRFEPEAIRAYAQGQLPAAKG